MPKDPAAELDARAAELDRREAAIDAADKSLNDRLGELNVREAELQERSAAAELAAANAPTGALTYNTLPEPLEGHGFVVVEAPLDLVHIFANLHPSERLTMCAQLAGAMRQTLMETGKLRRPLAAGTELAALAVLATGEPVAA